MINELRAVAIFVEVVRAGSFRGAARQLGLSPSAVSYNVAQLEKHVGNSLIYRSTRKLSLTSKGEHLYEHAGELLSDISASLEDITGNGSALHGRLIVSATTALLHSTLNQKIAQFCKQSPNIDFEIHYSDERQDLIRDGIDLVLRAGDMPDSSLKSRLVSRIERKLVCSRSYYKSHKPPQKPEELDTWRWIRLTMMPGGRTLRKAGKSFTTTGVASQISVNSVDAMTQFCSQGMGLATPPTFLVEKLLKRGSIIEVLPEWQVDSISVYAVWPGNHVRNKNAQKFVELVTDMG
ncbi:MAG: LysR family transcriptional regulator [Granulosicoccus sp.]